MNPGLSFQCGSRERNTSGRRNTTSIPLSAALRLESRCGHWLCAWMACPSKNRMVSLHSMDTIGVHAETTLLLVWRRSDMCSCGCLGWCSLHVIMRCLAWSLEAPAAGQRLRDRLGGTPFTDREACRVAQRATPLPKRCLVYVKFVHTCGTRSYNSNFQPCPCCSASADELGEVGATSVVSGPHPD